MAENQKLIDAVVAPGRTLVQERGKFISAGGKVRLPADEVLRLQKSGHLVDPEREPLPKGSGPSFEVKSGPTIKGGA